MTMSSNDLRSLADDFAKPHSLPVDSTWVSWRLREQAVLQETLDEVRRLVSLHEMARNDEMGFTDQETVARIADVVAEV